MPKNIYGNAKTSAPDIQVLVNTVNTINGRLASVLGQALSDNAADQQQQILKRIALINDILNSYK